VTLPHGAGAVVARRGAQGRFLVAVRAVAPPKRKARTAWGRTSKAGGRSTLLLREEIGSSVRYSKTLAAAQARACHLLRSAPEAGQAREVVKCGGRWYCCADLVAAGSKAMLVQQFVKGQAGQPPACNANIRLVRVHGIRTVRLSAVRPVGKGERVVVRYGGSAGRRVVAVARDE
jgi:hypothetical protein